MALIKSCCCCSLRAGTLIIGWLETILGVLGMIIIAMSMYLVSQLKVELEAEAVTVQDSKELENMNNVVIGKTAFAFAMMILIGLFLYYLCFTILAIFLIIGVHKENMRYVKLWVQIKSVLLILAIIGIVIQLFLLLLGVDSRLTHQIIVTVVDGLLIMVVQSYYDQVNERTVPTY